MTGVRDVPDTAKRVRAVAITMARDEAELLPRWVRYYGEQLGLENLIVLDDGTTDGSTERLPCTSFRLPPQPWRGAWGKTRRTLANALSRGLLTCYDFVIFTDVDEFLVPDPLQYGGLLDYLSAFSSRQVIAPVALNVLHDARTEPALDATRLVLEQRRYVKFAPGMCKPCIKSIPAEWQLAFHGIRYPFQVSPDLWMVHLKFADMETAARVARHRHALYENENRGSSLSAWRLRGDEVVARLNSWVAESGVAETVDFDPNELDLDAVVKPEGNGFYRTSRLPQTDAMELYPLRCLPRRFSACL
jgi:hypothetical protein